METLSVGDEIAIERDLHFLDGLEPSASALDAEVLVEQGAVEAPTDGVRLRPPDSGLRCSMPASWRNRS